MKCVFCTNTVTHFAYLRNNKSELICNGHFKHAIPIGSEEFNKTMEKVEIRMNELFDTMVQEWHRYKCQVFQTVLAVQDTIRVAVSGNSPPVFVQPTPIDITELNIIISDSKLNTAKRLMQRLEQAINRQLEAEQVMARTPISTPIKPIKIKLPRHPESSITKGILDDQCETQTPSTNTSLQNHLSLDPSHMLE